MALKLTITSDQRQALGQTASIVLGVGGGSIGRAHDNDWVLPDPQCYVSAHHARVQYRHGTYYLLDTSTNGVYVNGGTERISPRSIYPLRDGDQLRLGQYEVAVRIDVEANDAPEASAIFSIAAQSTQALDQDDIGVSFDVEELLQTATGMPPYAPSPILASVPTVHAAAETGTDSEIASASRIDAVDAYGQPVTLEDTGLQPLARAARPLALVPPISKPRRNARGAEPSRDVTATPAAPPTAAPVPPSTAEHPALEAFCRGAGLDVQRVPFEAQTRLLQLAGLLLREALGGLKGLALTQRELRDQAGLSGGREDIQYVGLTGLPVEELLLRLLLGHDRHELDAVQWLRDTAADSRGFDIALLRSLPRALEEFTARLDPRTLAHSLSSGSEGGDEPPDTGVTARFRSITDAPTGRLPQLFSEAFARTLTAELARSGRRDPSRG